ncbi:MAG: hypothetical protein ACE5GE_11695 [Phycisphaerae bacterium]
MTTCWASCTRLGPVVLCGILGTLNVRAAGPDVIVHLLAQNGTDINEFGPVGGVMAYAWGTTSCNNGNQVLQWAAESQFHPVIAQNMYRLKNGKLEQIGMAWLKHGFCALSEPGCGSCQSTGCETLGVGCADTYWAGLNDSGLKPRSPVNASTGQFPFPEPQVPTGPPEIAGRVQVQVSDIDLAQNPGARYFIEGHYVTQDDSSSGTLPGNGGTPVNNASWREVDVTDMQNLTSIGPTMTEAPAIAAWKLIDPAVTLTKASLAGDGKFRIAYKATDLGGGMYNYEYAVFNLDSHRSCGSFSIPIPAGVTVSNVGFHDVDYHSGEPYTNIDWPATVSGCQITWSTEDHATNPNANALRWSTLYNFRFDANGPPAAAVGTLGLFRPGTPTSLSVNLQGPSAVCIAGDENCDGDRDLQDYAAMQSCYGPGTLPIECQTFDTDCGGTLDLIDYSSFVSGFDGPQ